ncbi:MAG: thiol:disulfide interchange protein DsbA/DsbL [Pseudomonadales bacterium]|nr:thiol:disulfide interchange protein DsbA/DsbL [Pseudomonadales bacterium]
MRILIQNGFLGLIAGLVLSMASSLSADTYEAGVHYVELPKQKTFIPSDKVQVTEFFWYGCNHCFKFEPMLNAWQKTLADDVVFSHTPAMWNKPMKLHARAYYSAAALGVLDKVHQPLFDAININRQHLKSKAEIAEIFEQQGVSAEDFDQAFDAFGTISRVTQADQLARGYRISGVPTLVINGRYQVRAGMVKTFGEMIKVADYLIEKEREQLNK